MFNLPLLREVKAFFMLKDKDAICWHLFNKKKANNAIKEKKKKKTAKITCKYLIRCHIFGKSKDV